MTCETNINSIECEEDDAVPRWRRKLQTAAATLSVEFETIIAILCDVADCDDIDDEIVASYVQAFQASLEDSISDGSFGNALTANIPAIFGQNPTITFSQDVIISLLNALKQWYPTWEDGNMETCKNDGKAPAYSEFYIICVQFFIIFVQKQQLIITDFLFLSEQ